MLTAIRRSLTLIEPGRRRTWLLLIALAFLAGILDALGAIVVFALLGLLASPRSAIDLPVFGSLQDRFPGTDGDRLLTAVAIVIAVLVSIRAVVYIAQIYVQNRVVHNTSARLSSTLLGGYLRMPWTLHLQRNSAELIRNAFHSVQEVTTGVLGPFAVLASETLLVIAMVTVLTITAPLATLAALVVLGGVIAVVMPITQSRLAALGHVYQDQLRVTQQSLQESLGGLRDIRVLGREKWFQWEFDRSRGSLSRAQYKRATLAELPRVLLELFMMLFVLAFLVVTTRRGDNNGDALAVLGMFAYASLRLLPSVNKIVTNLNYLRFASAAVDVVKGELEIIDSLGPEEPAPTPLPFEEAIRLEDVRFKYDTGAVEAIRGMDLVIRKGTSIGVVGPTGGGKTTLVDLVLGLLAPTAGRITIDGVDLSGNERAWQQRIGMVPQSVFMADDTLRRNIALGTTDEEVDNDRIWQAVQLAQLEHFVTSLPAGLDTVIGEKGARLSGGQRQRVAIARALYRVPDVLIFDEGTSALDAVTEAELVEALESLRSRHTLITVAHRLTTVRACDQIVVVRDGRIADVGTFDELLVRDPKFARMAGTIVPPHTQEEVDR